MKRDVLLPDPPLCSLVLDVLQYSNKMPAVDPNAHPGSHIADGQHSHIPHPPHEDRPDQERQPTPYTGWDAPVPSKDGGDQVRAPAPVSRARSLTEDL